MGNPSVSYSEGVIVFPEEPLPGPADYNAVGLGPVVAARVDPEPGEGPTQLAPVDFGDAAPPRNPRP
eukprot:12889965-Prorocentrum_lima.AAC.1